MIRTPLWHFNQLDIARGRIKQLCGRTDLQDFSLLHDGNAIS